MIIYVFVCPICKQEARSLDKDAFIKCGIAQKGITHNHQPEVMKYSYNYQRRS